MAEPAPANGHAAPITAATPAETSSNGEVRKIQYPLTSWADTRQNVACIAFVLGCVFTLALSNGVKLFSEADNHSILVQSLSAKERFWNTITGPRLGIYIAMLVVFHMMEFLTTAIYNPSKASVRCKPFPLTTVTKRLC